MRTIIIALIVILLLVNTLIFAFQIIPNFQEISLLRKNPFGGHPQAIATNIRNEWKKIGGKTLRYLLIDTLVISIGVFLWFQFRPADADNQEGEGKR